MQFSFVYIYQFMNSCFLYICITYLINAIGDFFLFRWVQAVVMSYLGYNIPVDLIYIFLILLSKRYTSLSISAVHKSNFLYFDFLYFYISILPTQQHNINISAKTQCRFSPWGVFCMGSACVVLKTILQYIYRQFYQFIIAVSTASNATKAFLIQAVLACNSNF